jgi:hypothetical protein
MTNPNTLQAKKNPSQNPQILRGACPAAAFCRHAQPYFFFFQVSVPAPGSVR